jgi:phenylacetate-CoA ligase
MTESAQYSARNTIYRHDSSTKALLKGILAEWVPFTWRQGAAFRRIGRELKRSATWDAPRMRDYQVARMRAIVDHAARHVPWYRRTYAALGVGARDIRTVADIVRLPLLAKSDLQEAAEGEFRAQNYADRRLRRVMSGGTTGVPTTFHHLQGYSDAVFNAFRVAAWELGGYRAGVRALDLTWSFSGELLRFNPYFNWLSYSIARLETDALARCWEQIQHFRPRFIIGYPSTVALFGQLLLDRGLRLTGVERVITGSEMCYSGQVAAMGEAFGCKVAQWYGLSELAGFAGTCDAHGQFQFFPQAGYVELLKDDGTPAARPGEEGEIVLTGYHTWATPFIRYRTGDRGILGESCCGGSGTVAVRTIAGREQDYLVGKASRVPLSAVNCHTPAFRQVWKYQFVQRDAGRLKVRIVAKAEYGDADERLIDAHLRAVLGDGFSWEIERVQDIPSTQRGKHRFLVRENSDSVILPPDS